MRRRDRWPVAALLAMLALVAGCPARSPAVPGAPTPAQTQKEENTVKPGKKQRPKPEARPSGGPPGGYEAGMPDPGRGGAISPLAAQAIALARSKAEADHAQLARMLVDKAWLDRLDPPETAAGIDPRFLQLTRVLKASAETAPQALETPAGDALYRKPGWRQAALIEASGAATDPGPKLIDLWRSQLKRKAVELETTVRALVNSGSRAAVGLLEDAFASDAFGDELVFAWFRDPVLQHRQDPELLAGLERLLQGGRLRAKRRAALIEVLFEYRPTDWYLSPDSLPTPPKRADLTDAARARLRAIADRAVREGLIDSARRAQIEVELAPPAPGSDAHERR